MERIWEVERVDYSVCEYSLGGLSGEVVLYLLCGCRECGEKSCEKRWLGKWKRESLRGGEEWEDVVEGLN